MPAEFINDSLDAERAAGRREGILAERARLRPLLERCEAAISWHLPMIEGGELLADLCRELGKGEP